MNKINQWVSVKDSLPPNLEWVIVDSGLAYYREKEGRWYSITAIEWPGRPIQWQVTHWMKMPDLIGDLHGG